MIRNKVKTLIYNYMKIVNFIQEYKDTMEDIIIHKVATATTTSEVIVKEEQGNITIHLVAHDDHILIVKDYY